MPTDIPYAPTAYRRDRIPAQPPSVARDWIRRFSKARLPWGTTQEVTPATLLRREDPAHMRALEQEEQQKTNGTYKLKPFEHLNFHYIHDQERLRFARLPMSSRFWMFMYVFGKWGFIILVIPALFGIGVVIPAVAQPWHETLIEIALGFLSWFFGIPLLMWLVGWVVIQKLPKLWAKPSKGPEWELNRRTGMVTVFDYDNNGEYKKNGSIGEIVRPFYEFDAFVSTQPDRQGLPLSFLYLHHRYEDIKFSLAGLLGPDRFAEPHYALWDYLQNFMDTSRPLPDDPFHEPLRPLDPTSVEHDRQSGRDPRYWRDMDDDTFRVKVAEMDRRINAIDTLRRPNLMAQYCQYKD